VHEIDLQRIHCNWQVHDDSKTMRLHRLQRDGLARTVGEWIIPSKRMTRGRRRINPDKTDHHVCLSGARGTRRAVVGAVSDGKKRRI
jgi:hypothetical protein